MPAPTLQLSSEVLQDILRPPYWDPVPPWLELDRERLRRFADMEIEFKIKELQVQQEKLQQFQQLLG